MCKVQFMQKVCRNRTSEVWAVGGASPYTYSVCYHSLFLSKTKRTKFGLYRRYCLIANISSGYKIKSPVGGVHAN